MSTKTGKARSVGRLRRQLGWRGEKLPALGTVVQTTLGAERAGIVVAHGPCMATREQQEVYVKWIDAPEVAVCRIAHLTAHVDAVLRLAVLGMAS